ncbi:MAG: hypothetical protein HRF50_17485 [Phycisphaerae bacterium]|jgi:hypothetical protein
MRTPLLVSMLAGCLAAPSVAQNRGYDASNQAARPLQWRLDVKDAIAEAQRTNKPLMFWIVGSGGDRAEDMEQSQKRAFRDVRVVSAAQRWITVRLIRSQHEDLLKKWDLPPRTNLEVVFTAPDGDKLDTLAPSGVAHPDSFRQKMNLVFGVYKQRLFEKEVQPKLQDAAATPGQVNAVLKLVREYSITQAAEGITGMLQNENLDPGVRKSVLDTLAELSTPGAVNKLFEAALAGDADAAAALGGCTPVGAEQLTEKLGGEDMAAHLAAYNAIAKICKIKNAKPDRFWQGDNPKIKQDEIDRVKQIAEKAAKEWRRRNEDG